MRAAVLHATVPPGTVHAQANTLTIEELDQPEPRSGEIGVAITCSSLCHSDLSVVDGSRVRPLPMALGHEAVGRVVSLGAGVRDINVGDHVVLVFVPSCGSCRACLAGRPALCHRAAEVNGSGDLLHGGALLRTGSGERINHHLGVSAFADYAVGVMAAGLDLLTRGGALVSVGLPHPSAELAVPALQFAGAGKRLLGSYMGDSVPERDIPRYLGLWREGKLPIELLHTDTRPLEEINEGLDALAAGTVIRRLFRA